MGSSFTDASGDDAGRMEGSAVRYICLVAMVLALPLSADAQQRRAADRRSDTNQSQQRHSGDRRSDDRGSDARGSAQRPSDAKRPPHATTLPWWERQPTPWWEGKPAPAWENRNPPGWESGNVARALLDRQRLQQQRAEQRRHNQLPYSGSHRRPAYYAPSMVYVLPAYGGYFSESIATTTQYVETGGGPTAPVTYAPLEPPPPMGALRLEVEPRESLQIFVDGVYLGRPVDLGDQIEVPAGIRRIELRAPGYRTLTFTAEIADGRSITYRGTLERFPDSPAAPVAPGAPAAPAARAAPAAPAGSRVMYVIPGCYLGNVSPKTVALPDGCDISKLTTISP